MNEIQFEDQPDEFGRPPQMNQGTDFTGKLIAWGLASNRQQAEYLMIGAALAVLVIAYLVYSWGTTSELPPTVYPAGTEIVN